MFLYGMQVMGDGLAKVSGGKLETDSGKPDVQSDARRCFSVLCVTGCDPVVFRNHSYGSRLCKHRHHDTYPGSRCHYGCQYRYDESHPGS